MDLKLEQFEGPLDLLLHLIRANKIDIYDIPIFELTQQYIDYLKKMEELNMDIASEFIVMASELLYIKSKMLLPSEKNNDGVAEEDPREELVRKLIEYKKYSEMTSYFKQREHIGFNSFTKPKEKIKGLIKYNKLDMEKDELVNVLNILSERVSQRIAPGKEVFYPLVEREVVSVASMSDRLYKALNKSFKRELVEVFCDICYSRAQVSAAFMALLDLVKEEKVEIHEEFTEDKETFMLIKI